MFVTLNSSHFRARAQSQKRTHGVCSAETEPWVRGGWDHVTAHQISQQPCGLGFVLFLNTLAQIPGWNSVFSQMLPELHKSPSSEDLKNT